MNAYIREVSKWFASIRGRKILCSKKGRTFKKHVKRYAALLVSPPTLNVFKSLQAKTPTSSYSLTQAVCFPQRACFALSVLRHIVYLVQEFWCNSITIP